MKIKTKILFSYLISFGLLSLPMLALADWTTDCQTSGLPCTSVYQILMAVMNFGLAILTILAVIGFIISGIIYITAGGAGKADVARHWLTYSIVGLIVGMSGYIIIRLIDSLLRGNITN